MTLEDFVSYLNQRIKVDGKTGNLGDKIKLAKSG
jgi:hypothetical protein